MLLQPTSPLRTAGDIEAAIELLFEKKAGAVVSVCETEHHPLWSNILPKDGNMKNFLSSKIKNINRQELPAYYRINGAVYLAHCDYLKRNKGFIGNKTYAYIMPKEKSIDIDTKIDFDFAEFIKENKINDATAKDLLIKLIEKPFSPKGHVERQKLGMIASEGELERLCKEAIKNNKAVVEDYKSGKQEALHYLMGQVMRLSGGKANPKITEKLLKKLL